MKDPIICADGYSYERSAIHSHIDHRKTIPVTGQELASHMLTKNAWLSRAIAAYDGNTVSKLVPLIRFLLCLLSKIVRKQLENL